MNRLRQGKGCFITIDGPNGVGKSTIIAHLKERLRAKSIEPILTAEPTRSSLGLFIREQQEQYRGRTLACLVAADRYAHIEHEIKPALGKGQLVISDRYVLSSLVYQILDGVSMEFVLALNKDIVIPHLSVLLTASADALGERLAARPNLTRFEREHHMTEGILYEKALTTIAGMGFNCRRIENDQVSPEQCSEQLEAVVLQAIEAASQA
jgi:dTMP kinase